MVRAHRTLLSRMVGPFLIFLKNDVEEAHGMSRHNVYTRALISLLRRKFEGVRVELVSLFDPLRCPELKLGEHGTVSYVNDTGIIYVDWDSGISSEIVFDEDVIRTI